jgi:hypothetical protein
VILIALAPRLVSGEALATTQTNTVAIHYLTRPYDYNFQTGAFTLGENEAIPVSRSREHVCVYYDYFVFDAAASQVIRAHFDTANPLNFYVLTLSQYISFLGYWCGNNFWKSEAGTFTSSYDLNWSVPQNDVYVFLFTSHRLNGGDVPIFFNAEVVTAT